MFKNLAVDVLVLAPPLQEVAVEQYHTVDEVLEVGILGMVVLDEAQDKSAFDTALWMCLAGSWDVEVEIYFLLKSLGHDSIALDSQCQVKEVN